MAKESINIKKVVIKIDGNNNQITRPEMEAMVADTVNAAIDEGIGSLIELIADYNKDFTVKKTKKSVHTPGNAPNPPDKTPTKLVEDDAPKKTVADQLDFNGIKVFVLNDDNEKE